VILPDHIHTIWTLAEDDGDYPTRWRLLKSFFTRKLITRSKELITSSRKMKGEQAVWQRRYWEHLIIDAEDLDRHLNYIHYNPVKHGLVKQVKDWPWSSFHRFVRSGLYPADWGSDERFTTKTDDEVWKLAE
jgi:putative transposase